MHNVRYLHLFYVDLNATIEYISNVLCNPIASENLYKDTLDTIIEIRKNPYLHRPYEGSVKFKYEFRKAKIRNYYIFYYIDGETVNIVRLIYSMRDIDNLLNSI